MPKLAIIGDGYSAAVLVYHLIKRKFSSQDIMVFGPGDLGLGQAYGSNHDEYRLNVRDDLMQIDPDHPDDFAQWAFINLDDPDANSPAGKFYRRGDYAKYIKEKLAAITKDAPCIQIKEHVTSISKSGTWQISTAANCYDADLLILATGNPPTRLSFDLDQNIALFLTLEPWQGTWASRLTPQDDLVIIGGGLTAMDILASLAASNHQGDINIISPKGILPPPQLGWYLSEDDAATWPEVTKASQFLRHINLSIGKGGWHDRSTQEGFEHIRKGISAAWRLLPDQEQDRLKKHIGWLWQLLRYRASPQSVEAQHMLLSKGQLHVHKGRVAQITAADKPSSRLKITMTNGQDLNADHAFIATGAGQDPLLQNMASTGLISLKHGHVEVDEALHLINHDGYCHLDGFALGPPTAMSRGDVIGASTIAGEAILIAEHITILTEA